MSLIGRPPPEKTVYFVPFFAEAAAEFILIRVLLGLSGAGFEVARVEPDLAYRRSGELLVGERVEFDRRLLAHDRQHQATQVGVQLAQLLRLKREQDQVAAVLFQALVAGWIFCWRLSTKLYWRRDTDDLREALGQTVTFMFREGESRTDLSVEPD